MQFPSHIFREYDMRGIYPGDLNEHTAYALGVSLVPFLKLEAPNVFVAYDVRSSSLSLVSALMRGLNSKGARVVCGGVATTPMHTFSVARHDFDLGIMVTASHNPTEFNGFKICLKGGVPLYSARLRELGEYMNATSYEDVDATGEVMPPEENSYREEYINFLGEYIKNQGNNKKIVIDVSYGAVGDILKEVARRKHCDNWIFIADEPKAGFLAHGPNPLEEQAFESLRNAVKEHNADLGVIFDVDGDRVFFLLLGADAYIRSDYIGFLIAQDYVQREKEAKVLYDVRSGTGVREELKKEGIQPILVHVGHSYFKSGMRDHNAIFGFELSGHYYFREFFNADSGIVTFLKCLGVFAEKGDEIKKELTALGTRPHSPEMNFRVAHKDEVLKRIENEFKEGSVISYFDGVSLENPDFYINARPSGTEDVVRINIEANNNMQLQSLIQRIEEIIQK